MGVSDHINYQMTPILSKILLNIYFKFGEGFLPLWCLRLGREDLFSFLTLSSLLFTFYSVGSA